MNDTQIAGLSELIDQLHETILIGGNDSVDPDTLLEIEKAARRLAKQARAQESVDLARALEKLVRGLGTVRKEGVSGGDYASEILPALYGIEEFIPAMTLPVSEQTEDKSEHDEPLRLDLRPDYERVRRLEPAEQRLLETGLREGRRPVFIRVDECGGSINAVREQIERCAAVVRLVEEPSYDRILAVVVEPIAPGLPDELSTIAENARVTVQNIDPDSLRSVGTVAREWFRRLPPIRFETLHSSMETLQFYLEQVVRRSTNPFTTELADLLGKAFSVGMREILDSMQPSLEEIALREQRLVDIELLGDAERIGAEMGEALREALFELITNSILHGIETPEERRNLEKTERGRIQVRSAYDDTALRIDVVDDGAGLDEALLKDAMRDKERRSGLFRVRRMVNRRFGGKVIVRSGTHGTTVSLRLPALRGVFHATVFGTGDQPYCIPSAMVIKTMMVSEPQVSRDIAGGSFLRMEGRTIPYMIIEESGAVSYVRRGGGGWALLLRFCGKWIALASAIEPETGAAVPAADGTYSIPMLERTGVSLPVLPESICS